MKKIIILSILLVNVCYMEAGIVNKKMTKIRTSDEGSEIKFSSKIPHLILRVKEKDFKKAMENGYSRGRIQIERKKILNKIDREVSGSIRRRDNGVTIKAGTNEIFVTDKELKDLKNKY